MRLRERYRRFTKRYRSWKLPSKLTFWSFILSILGILIAVTLWLFPRAQEKFEWPNALEDMRDCMSGPCASRIFWILREPGASLTVGPCPSSKCFEFQLAAGPSRSDNEAPLLRGRGRDYLWQKFLLRGGGFGVQRGVNPSGGWFIRSDSRITIHGGGYEFIPLVDGYEVSMELRRDARFDISARAADMTVSVVDASVDSLKLLVALFPSTWKAGESE